MSLGKMMPFYYQISHSRSPNMHMAASYLCEAYTGANKMDLEMKGYSNHGKDGCFEPLLISSNRLRS